MLPFFVIDDALLIKNNLLKFIPRDEAYGQCELYDAHLWQVNNHHYIFALTFATSDEMSLHLIETVQHTLKTYLIYLD